MKYIAYYRVSTKEQGVSGLGLESQKESVRQFVSSTNGTLLDEFTDVASGKDDEREALNKALEQCQNHKAILVVKKLDRLSRGGFKIAVRLDELGIKYIESDSPQDNELLKDMKLAIAKDERKKISQRTKAALDQIKKNIQTKGKHTSKEGNVITSLGSPDNLTDKARQKSLEVRKRKAELNPNNKAAKNALELMEGKEWTLQQKADYLNKKGYKTSRGKMFTAMQVSRLLKAILPLATIV